MWDGRAARSLVYGGDGDACDGHRGDDRDPPYHRHILHHRMDDALGLDDHLHLIYIYVKKHLEIMQIIEDCMSVHKNIKDPDLEQILETEEEVYERIESRR